MARPSPGAEPEEPVRLLGTDRRDALLDAAAALVAEGDLSVITMDTVAERAGVSRPLVYKHFANREELLAAVYQREVVQLTRDSARDVYAAEDLEEKFRALIRGALRAEANRGATLAALRSAGVRNEALRNEQQSRDRTTVRYFADLAVRRFGLDGSLAKEAVAVILGAMQAVLAQWRHRPTTAHAAVLEDVYVQLAVGGLAALRGKR